jgi:hypothetical protein
MGVKQNIERKGAPLSVWESLLRREIQGKPSIYIHRKKGPGACRFQRRPMRAKPSVITSESSGSPCIPSWEKEMSYCRTLGLSHEGPRGTFSGAIRW